MLASAKQGTVPLQGKRTGMFNKVKGIKAIKNVLVPGFGLLDAVMDALPFKLYVVDKAMKVVAWNKKAEDGEFGVKKNDAVGKSLGLVLKFHMDKIISSKNFESMLEEFGEVFSKGVIVRKEEVSLLRSGDKRYYLVTKVPLCADRPGKVSHVITIIEDVTEKRKMELRLIARERLSSLGEMVGGVAHEINNPLASMTVCAGTLRRKMSEGNFNGEEGRGAVRECLEVMESEIFRCKGIISSMLDFSRDRVCEKVESDINRIVSESVRMLMVQGKYSGFTIRFDLDGNLPKVFANEGQIKQVFTAVAINSFDAMTPDTGILSVTSRRVKEHDGGTSVCVSFNDNGGGMDDANLTKIFTPFFTTKGYGRAGLGLSVSHGIITDHNGRIEVESKTGKGTTFRIFIPVAS